MKKRPDDKRRRANERRGIVTTKPRKLEEGDFELPKRQKGANKVKRCDGCQ